MNQFLCALCVLCGLNLIAAPLQWTCDWPEAKSQTFSLYQGETATFEPTFRVNGRTVTNATIEAVWYQTNGMGNAWWKLDGATFAPSNDVGAASYRFFVEASVPGSPFPVPQTIYRANGALRMLPSPGFTPNAIEPPIATLDFSAIEVAHAPWTEIGERATGNGERLDALEPQVATNAANIASLSSQLSRVSRDATNYTDTAISQIVIPEPDFSPSNATLVATIEATAPAPGDYANVSNAAMNALQSFTETDPTVPEWAKSQTQPLPPNYNTVSNKAMTALQEHQSLANYYNKTETEAKIVELAPAPGDYANVSNKAMTALQSYTESDPSVHTWAKAATKPTYTASEVGATTAADVYRLVAGTNVVLVVTNYNSATHAAAMKLQHLDPESGQYVTYWDELRQHEITYTKGTNYTDAAIAERAAPRAWSGTTSGLGSEAPAGVTWISTPETVIAGGFEYEKVVTSAGAVWVLTSNGMSTGATSNSFFRVAASDGTELFSIEKTDSYLIGVNADGITRSGNTVTIPINVVAAEHPYIRATTNLVNATWVKEDEGGFDCSWATVSWSGSTGAYVATVTTAEPQAFFYFEYMVEGQVKIKNSAKTEMSGGILFNGTTYLPTVNGNKLEFVAQ